MDPEDEVAVIKPADLYESLMTDRVISRNLRHLLKPKGICFKVDYANAHRGELSQLTQDRSLFTEGALERPIKDLKSVVLPMPFRPIMASVSFLLAVKFRP